MNKIALLMRKENTDKENKFYLDIIYKYNNTPLLIYDYEKEEIVLEKLKQVNHIILTGGNEVGRLDNLIIKYSLENNTKLLGICQGMQSMALYGTNNKLIQIKKDNHYQNNHLIKINNSKFKDIINKDIIEVNSYHHQKVNNSKYFNVVGKSVDNLIEIIEHKNNDFQIGVQWHPERMLNDKFMNNLFLEFFK